MQSAIQRVRAWAMGAVVAIAAAQAAAQWKPVEGHIMTRWAKDVTPEKAWPEYPRPTMVREKWQNLNGLWDYSITGLDPATSDKWDGKILVPFPVESALSGVGRVLQPDQALHYRRELTIPSDWKGQRILLHFGAVDWKCRVMVNKKLVAEHQGGYDPFSCDISDALKDGQNELMVAVWDPTDTGGQPRGKQWLKPGGIWYTQTSGIWQTVWMEPVSLAAHVTGLRFDSNVAEGWVEVTPTIEGTADQLEYAVVVLGDGDSHAASGIFAKGKPARLKIRSPLVWSPDHPFLYQVVVKVMQGKDFPDVVKSYVALRDVRMGPDEHGINRLLFNGKPLFQYGPLDQGFWPDGLYTPPTDEAMKFDIEAAKKMGCNMLRKHVKVESERFYYWCDKLGIMVWQDMPSPFFAHQDFKQKLPEISADWKQNFETEMHRMIDARRSHPSIVMWVPFNEGWGQNDLEWSRSMALKVKEWDPTRPVNNATGWTDMKVCDTIDIHAYPGPGMAPVEPSRASVLGEFGGLGLPVEGHTWITKNNWGYVTYKNKEELTDAYVGLMKQMPLLIGQGLSAAVYTQTTDVEIECNGWLTYDRDVWKIDPVRAAAATKALYQPAPTVKAIVGHAGEGAAATWAYSTEKPADNWIKPAFDDAKWKHGPAGFGSKGTPGAVIGTEWTSNDIWIRRNFELAGPPQNPYFSLHHDEDAEVFINGEPAATFKAYTSSYQILPLSDSAAKLLKPGKNTIAIHCHQTNGGQYIDCGLVDVQAAAK